MTSSVWDVCAHFCLVVIGTLEIVSLSDNSSNIDDVDVDEGSMSSGRPSSHLKKTLSIWVFFFTSADYMGPLDLELQLHVHMQ